MYITCLDMEGVLVPEIWIEFARESGIPELTRTTRDEPDYDKLMKWRLGVLREHGLGLKELTTVRGLQSIGFETIASGDSYNDLEMIEASKAGFLFRTTEKIKRDYPHLPAFDSYDELLSAIEQVIRA